MGCTFHFSQLRGVDCFLTQLSQEFTVFKQAEDKPYPYISAEVTDRKTSHVTWSLFQISMHSWKYAYTYVTVTYF